MQTDRFLKIGGSRTFFSSAGSGVPTVVLEAGAGSSSAQWALIAPALAEVTRTCVYDRPGLGRSDPRDIRRDPEHAASHLAAVLAASEETPPFILVGHSLGGLYARVFAARYPSQVAGLVLVDPTPTDLKLGWVMDLTSSLMTGSLPILTRLGLFNMKAQAATLAGELPEPARSELIASYGSVTHLKALRDEFRATKPSMEQARRAVLPPTLPVTVLSAERAMSPNQTDMVRKAQANHAAFVASLKSGEHQIVPGSTHISLVTEQPCAAAIVTAVRKMVDQTRVGQPPGG